MSLFITGTNPFGAKNIAFALYCDLGIKQKKCLLC